MSISSEAARDALKQLGELLPNWLALEQGRRERDGEIQSREGFTRELIGLREIRKPEGWQTERLKLLEQGAEYDKKRLHELYEERRHHEESTKRLTEAEPVLFHFADVHGLDAEPLTRLILHKELKRANEVLILLRRFSACINSNGLVTESDGDSRAADEARSDSGPRMSLDAKALALFIEDSSRKKKDIARLLGTRTQSLCPKRCPKLDGAMKAWRAPDPDRCRVRGSKDAGGNLEAYEEE